jgi:hypothetical protein
MKEADHNALPTSQSLLITLRNIGRSPSDSIDEIRRIAEAQARVLREALPGSTRQLPERISSMFPTIRVEYVSGLPAGGLAYWAGHRWHIHVRAEDTADERAFTLLYHLKHIIDHPVRQRINNVIGKDWDELAAYFAQQVLQHKPLGATP